MECKHIKYSLQQFNKGVIYQETYPDRKWTVLIAHSIWWFEIHIATYGLNIKNNEFITILKLFREKLRHYLFVFGLDGHWL